MINTTKGDVSLNPYTVTGAPDAAESQGASAAAPLNASAGSTQTSDPHSTTDPLSNFVAFFGLHPVVPRSPSGAVAARGSAGGTAGSAEATGASPAPVFHRPLSCSEPGAAEVPTTKVQPGESNLEQVADRLGLDPDELAHANPQIDESGRLTVGEDIALPPEAKMLGSPDVEWPSCYFPEGNLSEKQNRQALGAYYASTREAQLDAASDRGFLRYVRQLSPKQIDQQWRTYGEKFVAIASSRGHGLTAAQLDVIYVRHWGGRHDAAIERHAAVNKALSEHDPDAFSRGLSEYHDGKDLDALGEYREAETEESHSAFMLRHYVKALDLLRSAEDAGREYTLPQLERAVLDRGGAWDKEVGAIEQYLTFRGGVEGPGSPRPRPKEGPVPTEPVEPSNTPTPQARAPEPVGPGHKLRAGKVANDNQPAVANDNQQAVPRKMAVGDPYSEPVIDQGRRPTSAIGSKGRIGDKPAADAMTPRGGTATTNPGTAKTATAEGTRGVAAAKPNAEIAASYSMDLRGETVEMQIMRDGMARVSYGDKSSTISLNETKGNNATLVRDLGISREEARLVLREAYEVSLNVLAVATPQPRLLLSFAQAKGDPREYLLRRLNDPSGEHRIASDAFDKPPTEGIRNKARDPGAEAPNSLRLSPYAYVFQETQPGQFGSKPSATATGVREYQYQQSPGGPRGGSALTNPRAVVRVNDAGVIVEIVGVAKGVTREQLLEMFDRAGWKYKLE